MTYWLIGQVLLGWLLADLVGGVVHWLEDRVLPLGLSDWLDREVILPNREHHATPQAFTDGSFLSRNGTTWLATAVVGLPLLGLLGPSPMLLTAILGGLVTSQAHYWAHVKRADRPTLVSVAQRTGALQSVGEHARHHKPPSNRCYCMLTDWLNPWLDHWGVWGRLERLFGIEGDKT